jgi:hypothetical protein
VDATALAPDAPLSPIDVYGHKTERAFLLGTGRESVPSFDRDRDFVRELLDSERLEK